MINNEIVVGFDVSPSARAALAWAARQARSTGCTLRALHVVDWARAQNLYAMPVVEDRVYAEDDPVDAEYHRQIEEAFASIGPESDWTLQLRARSCRPVLVDQSRDARLLVVGSREHVGLGAHARGFGQPLLRQSREVSGGRRAGADTKAVSERPKGESS